MLPYTHRAEFGYQDTVSYSLAPAPAFIGLITPGFYGRGPWAYWGSWDRVELPYAGLVTLLLAAAAFLLPIPQKPRRLLPWLALALVGFAIALGGHTPVPRLADAHPARLWQFPGPPPEPSSYGRWQFPCWQRSGWTQLLAGRKSGQANIPILPIPHCISP